MMSEESVRSRALTKEEFRGVKFIDNLIRHSCCNLGNRGGSARIEGEIEPIV